MTKEVSSDEEKLKEYLIFQIHRNIVNLYKQHLVLLEDIAIEHHQMMKKLKDHVDSEYLETVDYLNKDKYNYFRKKTLDVGNESIRDLKKV